MATEEEKANVVGLLMVAGCVAVVVALTFSSCSENKQTREWEEVAGGLAGELRACQSLVERSIVVLETMVESDPTVKLLHYSVPDVGKFVVESRTFEQYQGTIGESLPDPPE